MAPGGALVAGTIRAMAPPADVDSGAPDDRMQKIVNLSKRRGLRVPVGRDLRRLPLDLRLRPHRRAAAAQREGRVVALDGAAARRRGRPRRRHPLAARGLGGLRPPGQLHRPAGRLPGVPVPVAPRQARRPRHLPELRRQGQLHRGPGLQPDVQDPRRPGGGRGQRRLPAARDGPGPSSSTSPTCCRPAARSRRSASPRWASRSATRSRPGNFIFRTREFEQMEMEFFVPPDEGQKWFEYWCQERMQWYIDLGIPAEDLRLRPHDADERQPLLGGHLRRGVPLPLGLRRARGHRQPQRLRPHAARRALGRDARLLRPGHRDPLRAPRDRARGRRHPDAHGLPARRPTTRRRSRARPASVLRLHHRLAPYKVAVLPLSRRSS